MNPCGSGQRLWRNRRYGPDGWGVTDEAHDVELRARGLPALLHPLRVHERGPARSAGSATRSIRPTRRRTSTAIRAPGTGTRTRRTSRSATSRGMGSSAETDRRPTRTPSAPRWPRRGEDPGEVELSEIEGGASRQTFLVAAGGEPRWVLRREPAARDVVQLARGRAARRSRPPTSPGVAVAPDGSLRARGRARSAPARATLMEFVAGTSVAPRVLRRDELAAARERLPGQLAAALAQIHTRRARRGRGARRGSRATRRSRRASCGRRSSTGSASRCRRSRPACAGCA